MPRSSPLRWMVVVAFAVTGTVMAGRLNDPGRHAADGGAAPARPGHIVIERSTAAPVTVHDDEYEAFVASMRTMVGASLDEDRVDEDDLIVMGRRICYHLALSNIRSTRDYVREYRTQRREIGVPVIKRLLVQGAAVAETAPATFCPEFIGAVSAEEAARIVGYKS